MAFVDEFNIPVDPEKMEAVKQNVQHQQAINESLRRRYASVLHNKEVTHQVDLDIARNVGNGNVDFNEGNLAIKLNHQSSDKYIEYLNSQEG